MEEWTVALVVGAATVRILSKDGPEHVQRVAAALLVLLALGLTARSRAPDASDGSIHAHVAVPVVLATALTVADGELSSISYFIVAAACAGSFSLGT